MEGNETDAIDPALKSNNNQPQCVELSPDPQPPASSHNNVKAVRRAAGQLCRDFKIPVLMQN
jgi:hypothetical protein